ncbi:MAG: hypothetical protein ACI83H_000292 [Glaciecola sp.]|jgi:hypothetical protein
MKALITLILTAFLATTSIAQEMNIETKSVALDNLITFIVENYSVKSEGTESDQQNISFLIQVPETNLSIEDNVILKQAFKLLSNRLTEGDLISIITYSGFNGVALKQVKSNNIEKILHTINNFKSSIKEFHQDGIELAYKYAKENFDEEAINSVVMVRNPNISSESENTSLLAVKPQKKKNNAVLITAISLLPELLAIIKN